MPLWVADMDFEVGSFIQDAISKRIKNKTYGYEIIPSDIKENISLWLEKRQNYTVDTNHIILTSGLLTTMNQCVELFTKVHDNIIIQTPIYPPFYDAVQKNNRHILENKLRFDGTKYVINFEELEEQMKDASMMIFCSPHNPVGRVWIKEELERIAALSIKYNVIIISDEVHFDIVYSNSKH
ncbi:MAG: aminotransferase class I/II-fold pyridoxal phosphate-dependent enzyme, partial [Campylobacteraceae bacterium]|nr:aminotransferase class I/II-fold pyridoxal phosphate-dependent enzyme [Campylobacteraceae bacterium]